MCYRVNYKRYSKINQERMRDGGGKVKAEAKPHEPEDQHPGESVDSPEVNESFQQHSAGQEVFAQTL